jgi:RND family efflux transporter MFP subunit
MLTDTTNKPAVPAVAPAQDERRPLRGLGPLALVGLMVAVVALGGVIYTGIRTRVSADVHLAHTTVQAAVPTVNMVYPHGEAPTEELVLPGTIQAFTDAPIYARTNGYLKRWYVDIGAHVKQGELLAEIDTPEIDQQLQQARADLKTAQANVALATTTAARWQSLVQSNSVSKQETDEKVGDLHAKQAIVESNAANARRLEELQSLEKVCAPFAGVITVRNTDIGALITAGTTAPGREFFHLAAIHTLRVYVALPEVYTVATRTGATASLTLEAWPGEVFHGTLVCQANAIDPASRTLLTEVDVENPRGQLLPGAYVAVHLTMPKAIRSVAVPANTLLFRTEGLQVGVVRHGQAELIPVTIGRDYGNTVEVVSGLQPTDPVIIDPADSLITGTPVQIKEQQGKGAAP